MLRLRTVYSDKYDLHLGDHVFPSAKYRLIHEALLEQQLEYELDFLEPQSAEDQNVLLVHTEEWVNKLKTGTLMICPLANFSLTRLGDGSNK